MRTQCWMPCSIHVKPSTNFSNNGSRAPHRTLALQTWNLKFCMGSPVWPPAKCVAPATRSQTERFAFQGASGQRVPKGRGSRFGSTWRLATRPLYGPIGRPRLLGRNFWGGNCPSAPGTPRKTTRCAQMGLGFTCERAMVKDTQQASDASLNSKAV